MFFANSKRFFIEKTRLNQRVGLRFSSFGAAAFGAKRKPVSARSTISATPITSPTTGKTIPSETSMTSETDLESASS